MRLRALSTAIGTGVFMLVCSPFLRGQAPAFMETFESGKIDPAVWDQRLTGTSTAAVEAVDGAHGKYALHIHYPAMARNSYAFLVSPHVPASLSGHLFGRVYMKVVGDIGPTHNALMFAGGPTWPASKFYEIGTRGMPVPTVPSWMPSFQENKSAAGQGRGEITYHSDGPVPIGKWFLLEWELNDNPAAITVWVDGEKVVNVQQREDRYREVRMAERQRDGEWTYRRISGGRFWRSRVGGKQWRVRYLLRRYCFRRYADRTC